jgi:hypothetical protein
VILSSLGIARNSLLFPALVLKLSTVLSLTPHLSYSGYYKILVFLRNLPLYVVRQSKWFRLRIMMYFTNACTKHIEINYHFVHHHLLQGTFNLCPIASIDRSIDWCIHQSTYTWTFLWYCFQTQVDIYITTLSLKGDVRIYYNIFPICLTGLFLCLGWFYYAILFIVFLIVFLMLTSFIHFLYPV